LDGLDSEDFDLPQTDITIHLFSNILDIDDYSQNHLINLIETTQSNINYFVCASPYIDVIKTERLESFKRHFENKYDSFEMIAQADNPKSSHWHCNDLYRRGVAECPDCCIENCWTRVMRIFKVTL
jgi:hypothetical protein